MTLKEDVYKIYKKVGRVKSKAVNDFVVFNRYGWIHLSYTSGGHRRVSKDRRLRLHLFPFASEVIKKAKKTIRITEGLVMSKREIMRKVKYYELAGSCDDGKKHLTVIIRKIENGNAHFYSLRRTSPKIKKALEKGLL